MKANELRIGNCVLCNGLRTIVNLKLLESIYTNNIIFTIEPIPLTEEWLLKCGFEWREGIEQESSLVIDLLGRIKIVYYSGNVNFTSLYQDNQCIDFVTGKIKYIHQLQNLYFALIGEELNIEL